MSGAKYVLNVKGMTCPNCEKTIYKAVKKLDGVIAVSVSFPRKNAEIIINEEKISIAEISAAIEDAGYDVILNDGKVAKHPVGKVLPVFLIIISLYLIVKFTFGFDVFNLIPKIDKSISLFALFITGLLTSVHCIAMCGGINVSQCAGGGDADGKKFSRPLMYNMGRVLSYTIIGGLVGGLGSVLFISLTVRGIIMLVAAGFMALMGLSMLGWLPFWLVPRLPAKWSAASAKAKIGRGPFTVGLLNGLMPCGPLQAMQIYALSTGSILTGALSMFIFAMGTVPLMLGAGMIISMLKKKYSRAITRASAVFVILIAVVMVGNATNFFGWNLFSTVSAADSSIASSVQTSGKYSVAKIENGVQTVEGTVSSGGYPSIVVQKGIPVKFNLKVASADLNGCNGAIIIPKFNLQKSLSVGDNIVEFTPQTAGTINYTCWMGMISARIYVVADLSNTAQTSAAVSNPANALSSVDGTGGTSLGGCCSGGSTAVKFANGKIPLDEIAVAVVSGDTQTVTVKVNDAGYSPALLVVQKDLKTVIKFDAEKLNSCNKIVSFPDYGASLDLSTPTGTATPALTLTKDITFSCGMGMLHGYVKVVDDINNFDADAIRKEVANYKFSAGGGCCGT